jgi:hypothetical protein
MVVKFLLLISCFLTLKGDNNLLTDGTYNVIFSFFPKEKNIILKINNSQFREYTKDGDSANGKIDWIDNSHFILYYKSPTYRDSTELERIVFKSFGHPFYELHKGNLDTIKFRITYTGNLEVTINYGYIIKVK